MKNRILITFIFISLINNLNAGGVRTSNSANIDVFEQTFNFYYKSVNDTIKYLNKKGKERFEKSTTNITFYDIDKDSTFNIFDNTFNEKIVAFLFESEYIDSSKQIIFDKSSYYYGLDLIKNNRNIKKRKVSEKLFIVTFSYDTQKYTLWTCHKTGGNLKKNAEFEDLDDLKIDVFNKNILTLSQKNKQISIKKIEY